MKATGIVRRIDDLGRIVIPKEIRRTQRIREGDPLEIYVGRDGEVILKKYSPINELGDFAHEYAAALADHVNHIILIIDRDSVIAAAGGAKKDYLDKRVGSKLEKVMEERRTSKDTAPLNQLLEGVSNEQPLPYIAAPIIAGGDPIGAVLLIGKTVESEIGAVEQTLIETAASFLARQMHV